MKNASLQVKIVGALAVMFLAILVSIVAINYRDQRLSITAEVQDSALALADAVYTSMIYPMAVGDGNAISSIVLMILPVSSLDRVISATAPAMSFIWIFTFSTIWLASVIIALASLA